MILDGVEADYQGAHQNSGSFELYIRENQTLATEMNQITWYSFMNNVVSPITTDDLTWELDNGVDNQSITYANLLSTIVNADYEITPTYKIPEADPVTVMAVPPVTTTEATTSPAQTSPDPVLSPTDLSEGG